MPSELAAPSAMHETEQVIKLPPSSIAGLDKHPAEREVMVRQQVVLGPQRYLRCEYDVYGGWRALTSCHNADLLARVGLMGRQWNRTNAGGIGRNDG